MSELEIKECPFCGGMVERYGRVVCCNKCGVMMGSPWRDDQDAVVARWNTRHERTCEWEETWIDGVRWFKTACGRPLKEDSPFCPRCGGRIVVKEEK